MCGDIKIGKLGRASMNQKTVMHPVSFEGVGLHSGKFAKVRLIPEQPNRGVRFQRVDIPGAPLIPATVNFVSSTNFATTLSSEGIKVSTTEHLLSAITALGISNLLIEVEGEEVPILDGSSMPFMERIIQAGILQQAAARPELVIKKPISVSARDKCAHLLPGDGFRITSTIKFDHPLIVEQSFDFTMKPETYRTEIAPSRTFGFLRDVEQLRRYGLALGGTLDNAIVLDDNCILNPEGLRFRDEFVRHKILDAIGDVALLGIPIRGHLIMEKSGHEMHHRLLTQLIQSPHHWEIMETPSYFASEHEKYRASATTF